MQPKTFVENDVGSRKFKEAEHWPWEANARVTETSQSWGVLTGFLSKCWSMWRLPDPADHSKSCSFIRQKHHLGNMKSWTHTQKNILGKIVPILLPYYYYFFTILLERQNLRFELLTMAFSNRRMVLGKDKHPINAKNAFALRIMDLK